MSGVSKHYILERRGQLRNGFYLDHAIITVLVDESPGFQNTNSARRMLDFQDMCREIAASHVPWRKKIQRLWALQSPSSRNAWTLTEYRVRPGASAKSCKFRSYASMIRGKRNKNKPLIHNTDRSLWIDPHQAPAEIGSQRRMNPTQADDRIYEEFRIDYIRANPTPPPTIQELEDIIRDGRR